MLKRVEINRFRCLHRVNLEFDSAFNLIVGPNGSGKTSLLEAVFFLGRGRSFRSRKHEKIIQSGQSDFTLFGEVLDHALITGLGVGVGPDGAEFRIHGQKAESAAKLSLHLAPHIIDPEVHKLLEEGPNRRRRFMDFGVFHVEPSFLNVWYRYHRALKQRNAHLKSASTAKSAFDEELILSGEQLHRFRAEYLSQLRPRLDALGRQFLNAPVSLHYQPGFSEEESLSEAVQRSAPRDLKFKTTHIGPHRADIALRVDGVSAKERVSRGQQKLLAAALTLAQLEVIEADTPGRSILLLDDPAAELDERSLGKLMAAVREFKVQTFVTALQPMGLLSQASERMFHVEQGEIQPV